MELCYPWLYKIGAAYDVTAKRLLKLHFQKNYLKI